MASLLEELLQPISAGSFCGEDPTYEPEFEAARNEAEKISENNWSAMEAAARKLLTKKAKDMRVLGFLTLSTAMSKGLNPFAEAVQAYVKLVTEHWDDIHPKRPNGRANALRWLNEERLLYLIGGLKSSGDYDALSAAVEALKQFQTFCDGKFPGGSPPFGGFTKVVRQLAESNKPRVETPAPESAVAGTSGGTGSSGGGAPAALASFEDCMLSLQAVAAFLLGQDPANPLAFRLSRMAIWSGITGNIPGDGGLTMLPPPSSSAIDGFKSLAQQAQWADLVKNAEESLGGDGMFLWLDLQRFACTGLKALGGNYPACARAVMQELAQLLQRAPGLSDLKFSDGTPFADSMTKEWLETEVKGALGGGGGGMPVVKKKGDVGEEQKQAFALLEAGKLPEAMHVFRTGLANDSNRKNNFDRKLLLAELCFKGNKPHISHAMLEELRGQITHHDLETWDPDSCLQVYRLTQKVCGAMADVAGELQAPALRSLALDVHAKISRLDPVAAFQTDLPA